jgi:uncharacterized protein YjdB
MIASVIDYLTFSTTHIIRNIRRCNMTPTMPKETKDSMLAWLRWIGSAAAMGLMLAFASCGGKNSTIKVTDVKLSQATLTLSVGDTRSLAASVLPTNAGNKNVTWVSSDVNVATITQQTDLSVAINALAPGTTSIIVSTEEGGHMATCVVTVAPTVTGVSLNKTSLPLLVGGSETLIATVVPNDALDRSVTWMSDKTAVATVDSNGTVVGKADGTATIIVITHDGGKMASCAVTVEVGVPVPVTGITISKNSLTIGVGNSSALVASVVPANATNKAITWSSSDTSVATVAGGLVSAVNGGTATITATSDEGGRTASCIVTVANVYVAGYEFSSGVPVAKLWKNGTGQNLSSGSNQASANSIYSSGDIVYVAGNERPIARLWTNNVPQNLTHGPTNAEAHSVHVYDNIVYVAGFEINSQGRSVAKLWKNGIPTDLTDGSGNAEATSVYVSGDVVYVAGHETVSNRIVARLWINEQALSLSSGSTDTFATAVYVLGSNFYVAGYERAPGASAARLWVNGNVQNLTDGNRNAIAKSVYVSNGTILVAGHETSAQGRTVATLWVNGNAQRLSTETRDASANSVYMVSDDIYVAGFENSPQGRPVAKLWLNSIPHDLSSGNDNAVANSVYLK